MRSLSKNLNVSNEPPFYTHYLNILPLINYAGESESSSRGLSRAGRDQQGDPLYHRLRADYQKSTV